MGEDQWEFVNKKSVRLSWSGDTGADSVGVTGSFCSWGHPMPMSKTGGGDWELVLELDPGSYDFKFVVDGRWLCSEGYAKRQAGIGQEYNNYVQVD